MCSDDRARELLAAWLIGETAELLRHYADGFEYVGLRAEGAGLLFTRSTAELRQHGHASGVYVNLRTWLQAEGAELPTVTVGGRELSPAERLALIDWRESRGTAWRRALLGAWLQAAAPGHLQALRNRLGPAWLANVTDAELTR